MSLDKYTTLINKIEKSIISCNSRTINYVNENRYEKYPDLYFVLLTIRLLTAIESSVILLKMSRNNSYHLLSIGNILRSGLLDCLHFYYLVDFINPSIPNDNDQIKLIEEIKRINCNQIYHVVNYLRYIKENNVKPLTNNHFIYFETCKECFSDGLFDIELKNAIPYYKNKLTTKHLVENISQKKIALELFDYYTLYSKYDHYGLFTAKIFENNTNEKIEEQMIDIFFCIQHFYYAIKASSAFCFKEDISRRIFIKAECENICNTIIESIKK